MKLKLILSIGLSAFFLWWALKGLNFVEIGRAFGGVNWIPVALMLVPMTLTHLFRARRWKILVRPVKEIPLWDLFKMNMVGFMSISLFPLRLGEVTRPLLLKKLYQIPFATGVATIALERIFDALVTALILVTGLLGAPFIELNFPGTHVPLRAMVITALLIVGIACVFLVLAVVARQWAHATARNISRLLPQKLHQRMDEFFTHFFDGVESLPNLWALFRLFLESIGVWGAVVAGYLLAILAFRLHLHPSAVFTIVGFSAAGVSIPAAPGSVGTLHAAVQAALILYGVDKAGGLAFAIVVHAVNFLYTVVSGLIFLPGMSMGMGRLYDEASHQA